jgi:enoyl-CoA hydratase
MTQIVNTSEQNSYCLINLDDGKANALSFDMLEQLNTALDRAESAHKVVVIAGRPGKFSAGFDLKVMSEGGEEMIRLLLGGARLSRRLLAFPLPVVLAVSGHALAMGALLTLSADYRIGISGDYKIGLNEVAIGMTMPYFGVALARARLHPMHFENAVGLARIHDAEGAMRAGFLDEVVRPDELMDRAAALAGELSQLDMEAHRNSKARVREPLFTALDEALAREFPRR